MLASEAITAAYREAAITAIGEVPTTAQFDEGLARLNGFIASLLGGDVGRIMADWPLPYAIKDERETVNSPLVFGSDPNLYQRPDITTGGFQDDGRPPPNSRVLWRGDTPRTVFFDNRPTDGARMSVIDVGSTATLTINGNGRIIAGQNELVFTGAPKTYFYRAELASWIELRPLVLGDELPLAAEFDDLLISGTAIRLAPLDEINTHPGTKFIYERLLRRCQQRYNQRAARAPSGHRLPLSRQAF